MIDVDVTNVITIGIIAVLAYAITAMVMSKMGWKVAGL